MNAPQWSSILIRKLRQKKAPSFIVLRYPNNQGQEDLQQWIQSWLTLYLKEALCLSQEQALSRCQMGHADLIEIKKTKGETHYKIENSDLKELFQAQGYLPIELPTKVIFIHDGHLIRKPYANKLLKTLEEPQERTSIFLLCPFDFQLLQTIESRAITLKIPSACKAEELAGELSKAQLIEWARQEIKKAPLKDKQWESKWSLFFENKAHFPWPIPELLKNHDLQQWFIQFLLDTTIQSKGPYQQKQKVLDEIKWFQEASVYHNSAAERFYGLIHTVLADVTPQDA